MAVANRPTIVRFGASHFRLPTSAWWPVPLSDRTLEIERIELVTVELETSDGVVGSGYTYTLGRGGAAVCALLRHDVAPMLVGRAFDAPAVLFDELWIALQRVGRGGMVSVALGAADVACYDAAAKAAGLPLYRFLGARRATIPAYGSSIDLGYDDDLLLETVRAHLARGLRAVKIKVGRALRGDLRRLGAVRDLIGPDVRLMVDANTGWDLPEALRRAAAMAEADLTWLEEPLNPDDAVGHAELQAHTDIAIAAGETLFSVAEFATYLRLGALRYLQPDVARVGGITPWLRVATLAHAADLPLAPHFMQDIHVHLLCAAPNGFILEHLPLLDALLEEPLVIGPDGTVAPPERLGTGVRFASEALAPHRVP